MSISHAMSWVTFEHCFTCYHLRVYHMSVSFTKCMKLQYCHTSFILHLESFCLSIAVPQKQMKSYAFSWLAASLLVTNWCNSCSLSFFPSFLSSFSLPLLFSHLLYQWHAAAMLRSGRKVAVGDIVKVTNGQHLPADMVIVSSRSGSVRACVRV